MSSKSKTVAECSISESSEIEKAVENLTMASKKIVLISSDGESFEIDEAVAREFQIIAHMIEDDCAGKAIPVDNVTGEILALVIQYGKKHVEAGVIDEEDEKAKKELETWDTEFMKNLDLGTIFHLILAANYLNFEGLLDICSQTVADYIKDKEPEEVRKIFNIYNDFTPAEEEAIRKENAWCFNDPNPPL